MRVSQIRMMVSHQFRYALSLVTVLGWMIGSVGAQNCPQFAAPVVTGHLLDSRWTDISGLAASRRNPGVFWFHNDGGPGAAGSGDFFAVSREGRLLAEFRLNAVNTLQAQGEGRGDIEDVAVGPAAPNGETLRIACHHFSRTNLAEFNCLLLSIFLNREHFIRTSKNI